MHSKKELIETARLIAKESEEVVRMAKKVAEACTDKRMKRVRVCSNRPLSIGGGGEVGTKWRNTRDRANIRTCLFPCNFLCFKHFHPS